MPPHNGIPFHANDRESDQGDFNGAAHHANKKLYRDLTTILVESKLSGLGIAIDSSARREVFPRAPNIEYFTAFSRLLEFIAARSAEVDGVVELTFDVSTENKYKAGLIYSQFREDEPRWAKRLGLKISFAPAGEIRRLQVADLVAYDCMKVLDNERTRSNWMI